MKNRITLTNRILPAGGVICLAGTVALLISTGAPALADADDFGSGPLANPDLVVTPPFVPTSPYGHTYANGQRSKTWKWSELEFPGRPPILPATRRPRKPDKSAPSGFWPEPTAAPW